MVDESVRALLQGVSLKLLTLVADELRRDLNSEEVNNLKRATQEEILNRRKAMLSYDRLGLEPVDWIPEVAEEFACSEEAVKKDWSERKRWMQTYLRIDDVENMALDILADYELALNDAMKLYNETEDVKLKIQTLWLRFKAIDMKMDYLREPGALSLMKREFSVRESVYRAKRDDETLVQRML